MESKDLRARWHIEEKIPCIDKEDRLISEILICDKGEIIIKHKPPYKKVKRTLKIED